jgi:hypothetical protein
VTTRGDRGCTTPPHPTNPQDDFVPLSFTNLVYSKEPSEKNIAKLFLFLG